MFSWVVFFISLLQFEAGGKLLIIRQDIREESEDYFPKKADSGNVNSLRLGMYRLFLLNNNCFTRTSRNGLSAE